MEKERRILEAVRKWAGEEAEIDIEYFKDNGPFRLGMKNAKLQLLDLLDELEEEISNE